VTVTVYSLPVPGSLTTTIHNLELSLHLPSGHPHDQPTTMMSSQQLVAPTWTKSPINEATLHQTTPNGSPNKPRTATLAPSTTHCDLQPILTSNGNKQPRKSAQSILALNTTQNPLLSTYRMAPVSLHFSNCWNKLQHNNMKQKPSPTTRLKFNQQLPIPVGVSPKPLQKNKWNSTHTGQKKNAPTE
jgi:hypothetical protein